MMSNPNEWSIERICDALGNEMLTGRFLAEIRQAPREKVLGVFDRWQGIAERILAAVERGTELAKYDAAGLPLPGTWVDVTDRVTAEAEQLRPSEES